MRRWLRIALVVLLLFVGFSSTPAFAEEVSPQESVVETTAETSDENMLQLIGNVWDVKFRVWGYNVTLWHAVSPSGPVIRMLVYIVPMAVLLVFLWWGLRKALRMLMSAWRRGRINA